MSAVTVDFETFMKMVSKPTHNKKTSYEWYLSLPFSERSIAKPDGWFSYRGDYAKATRDWYCLLISEDEFKRKLGECTRMYNSSEPYYPFTDGIPAGMEDQVIIPKFLQFEENPVSQPSVKS